MMQVAFTFVQVWSRKEYYRVVEYVQAKRRTFHDTNQT